MGISGQAFLLTVGFRAFGEGVKVGKGWGCNTWLRRPHSKHVWNIPSHSLLQTNYCTRNSRKNAIVLRPLRAIASHELLHELLRQQTTIAATPLAESTPSPNSQGFCAYSPFRCSKTFSKFPTVSKTAAILSQRASIVSQRASIVRNRAHLWAKELDLQAKMPPRNKCKQRRSLVTKELPNKEL